MKKLIKRTIVLSAMAITIPAVVSAQNFEVSQEVVTYRTQEMGTVEDTRTEHNKGGNLQMKKDTFFKEISEAKTQEEIEAARAKLSPQEMAIIAPEYNVVFESIKQKENDEKALKIFDIIDIDADGFISKEEFINFHRKVSQKKEEKMRRTNNNVETYTTKTITETPTETTTETVTETITETSFSE